MVRSSGTGPPVYPARTIRITRWPRSAAASGVIQSARPPPWISRSGSPSPPESVYATSAPSISVLVGALRRSVMTIPSVGVEPDLDAVRVVQPDQDRAALVAGDDPAVCLAEVVQ